MRAPPRRWLRPGIPVYDESGGIDKKRALDLIDRELRGQKVYGTRRDMEAFERELAEEEEYRRRFEEDAALVLPDYAEQNETTIDFTALRLRAEEAGATEDEIERALEAQADLEAERRLRELIARGADRGTRPEQEADVARAVGESAREGEGERQADQGVSTEEEPDPFAGAPAARLDEVADFELTAPAAPRAAARRPQPPPQTADLFGPAPVLRQQIADLEREKDRRRNTGQESVETGDPTDLFSQARQQVDLEDVSGRPAERAPVPAAPVDGELIFKEDGKPFSTRKAAMLAARNRKGTFEAVQVEGGWALWAVAETAKGAAPDKTTATTAPAEPTWPVGMSYKEHVAKLDDRARQYGETAEPSRVSTAQASDAGSADVAEFWNNASPEVRERILVQLGGWSTGRGAKYPLNPTGRRIAAQSWESLPAGTQAKIRRLIERYRQQSSATAEAATPERAPAERPEQRQATDISRTEPAPQPAEQPSAPGSYEEAVRAGWKFEQESQATTGKVRNHRFNVTLPDGTTHIASVAFPKDQARSMTERKRSAFEQVAERKSREATQRPVGWTAEPERRYRSLRRARQRRAKAASRSATHAKAPACAGLPGYDCSGLLPTLAEARKVAAY